MIRALIVSGPSVGSFCSISATVPVTIGVAILVPLKLKYVSDMPLPLLEK